MEQNIQNVIYNPRDMLELIYHTYNGIKYNLAHIL